MTNVNEITDVRLGSLAIVGTGIQAVSQMTVETLSYISDADVVFYHATNGVTASQIEALNPNAIDIYEYYADGKNRSITYIQMAELMLREVRRGCNVVGIFHGHPGYFVSPARRALAIASKEGYPTTLLPAVSAPDCMFADLRVDPGVRGCQILMASYVLNKANILATSGHVVFLQVNAVGHSGFSFSGSRSDRFPEFIERLIAIYGETQDCIYYMAAVYPGCDPEISVHQLSAYRRPEVIATVGPGIFYFPPKGISFASLQNFQAFNGRDPYGRTEKQAINELATHQVPQGYIIRRASAAMLAAVSELGANASSRELYRTNPSAFVERHPDLTSYERSALVKRRAASIRSVTTRRMD
jgi:precorrin-2 methylase